MVETIIYMSEFNQKQSSACSGKRTICCLLSLIKAFRRGMVKTATNQNGDRTKQQKVKTATGTLCG